MRVCFYSLGCDKNRADSEKIISYLINKFDVEIVYEPKDSDIVIVNTCAFIKDAKNEAITIIKYLKNLKKQYNFRIFIIGCLTKDKSVDLEKIIGKNDKIISLDDYLYKLNCINDRAMDVLSFSSSLKISDGCNKRCSYCIIPNLKGKYVSNTIENLYEETKKLVKNGTREISIVAQDTLQYGIDLYNKKSIVELIDKISNIKNLKWIRLLYCYPEEIDDNIINMIKNNKKVLHYIDMPLQHINNDILKSMNRMTRKENIINVINKLRSEIPDIIIRTTFIVGYPGETDEQFNELIDFVKTIKFDKVGVFTYSREIGTKSYDMPNQVDEKIKKIRQKKLLSIQENIVNEKKNNYINKIFNVIIEGYDINKKMYKTRSYMDARDIDEVIYIKTKEQLISGNFINVRIKDVKNMDLIGVIDESTK